MDDLTQKEIRAMREWIADIEWGNHPDLSDLSDEDVVGTVYAHYEGGLEQFLRDRH